MIWSNLAPARRRSPPVPDEIQAATPRLWTRRSRRRCLDAGDRCRHRRSPGHWRHRCLRYVTEHQDAYVADHQDAVSFPSLHHMPPVESRRALTAIDDPLHPTCPSPDAATYEASPQLLRSKVRRVPSPQQQSMIVVQDGSAAPAQRGATWLRSSSVTLASARGCPACQSSIGTSRSILSAGCL